MLGISRTSASPTLTLSPENAYSDSTLWTLDTSSASSPNNNGFFPLRPLTNSQICVQSTATLSTTTSGIRFLRDSSSLSFTTRSLILKTFISSHGPIFCYAKNPTPLLPVRVDVYLAHAILHPANTAASEATLASGTSLEYSGPTSDGSTATAYITVRDAPDAAYVNYSDFTYSLLYTSGWTHVTLRYNNESNNLEAALFPGLGWIYNLDSNYYLSAIATGGSGGNSNNGNPLKILRRSDGTMRLHIYVDTGGVTPTFPAPAMANTSLITSNDSWALVMDSGTSGILVEAHMVADDETGTGVTSPDWVIWDGLWGQTTFH